MLQAQSCDKTEKVVGGDLFFVEVSCNSKASTSCLKEGRLPITSFCSDNEEGRYRCGFQVPSRLHNEISVAVISYIPEGLFGEYFSDISFKFPLYSRIDKRVNFTWDDEIERVNEFSSVRWSGSILSNFSEIFEFTILYFLYTCCLIPLVDNVLLIDKWDHQHSVSLPRASARMTASRFHSIRIECCSVKRDVKRMKLFWESPSLPREVIPPSVLFQEVS
mmetsp:Transcript_1009/g.1319  ORF Transcript_1009/g.1319 Transcript_1009/m.1319 type:complete len:220 (+) Transcript_1009:198-857(+)